MAASFEILKSFAPLLRYPDAGYAGRVKALLDACAGEPTVQVDLNGLLEFTNKRTILDLEEEFTRTFDINPAVTLDVGFHLFGLAYKRGEFLVKMRQGLARCNMDQGTELADHLPTLLDLAAALPSEDGLALVEECIAPAVKRMVEGLPEGNRGFAHSVAALHAYLAANYRCADVADPDLQDEAHDITQGYEYSPGDLDDLHLGVSRHV